MIGIYKKDFWHEVKLKGSGFSAVPAKTSGLGEIVLAFQVRIMQYRGLLGVLQALVLGDLVSFFRAGECFV